MPILNLDKLKQKKAEYSAAIVTAMKEQDESKLDAALDGYSQFIGEAVQAEIMAAETARLIRSFLLHAESVSSHRRKQISTRNLSKRQKLPTRNRLLKA